MIALKVLMQVAPRESRSPRFQLVLSFDIFLSGLPPGGRADNSPAIYRWVTSLMTVSKSPGGTAEEWEAPNRIHLQPSLRDFKQRALPFPAMNCWAILTHPSGMFPDNIGNPSPAVGAFILDIKPHGRLQEESFQQSDRWQRDDD